MLFDKIHKQFQSWYRDIIINYYDFNVLLCYNYKTNIVSTFRILCYVVYGSKTK